MTLLGIDVSHHQGVIDFAAVKRAGYSFVYIKASEGGPGSSSGTAFRDPMFAANRTKAHAAGLIVGAYHWAGSSTTKTYDTPAAEVAFFRSVIGGLRPGEFCVLDDEMSTLNPRWSRAWLDEFTRLEQTRPLLYTGEDKRTSHDWSPVVAGNYGLILAHYDGLTSSPPAAPWPFAAMKQFTNQGGPLRGDCNVFFGDMATLTRYCKQAPAPTPKPAPEDFDMPYSQWPAAEKAALQKDIAAATAAAVWNSDFPVLSGPLKGQRMKGGKALEDIWHNVTDTGGGLFALVKKIAAKLGA